MRSYAGVSSTDTMSSSSFSAVLPFVNATSAAASIERGIEPGDRAGRGVHHHERVEALRREQRNLTGHHPAHRMAEQPETVERTSVGDVEDVVREPLDRIRVAIGRLVAGAVPTVVEHDDGVIAREGRNVVGEVFFGAAEPVHQQQARTGTRHLDRQPDPVARRDAHGP